MKLLLLGGKGQVGRELSRTLAPLGEVQALDRSGADLADLERLRAVVRSAAPSVIVNAAGYTDVDGAETERDLAFRVNADAPAILAEEAARSSALLVHFSTDYVFDGNIDRPYVEDDPTSPLNVYGASKLAGDEAILSSNADAFVFRISWVYAKRGRNFPRKIQELALERDEVKVVSDQHGSPTWARSIARATTQVIKQWVAARHEGRPEPPLGLYHMTAPDYTTWYGFAQAIVNEIEFPAGKSPPVLTAISSSEYPTSTRRPRWSVLDSSKLSRTFGLTLPSWREQLAEYSRSM
jgi:dTDP-4-dehydrorhamnose reductase